MHVVKSIGVMSVAKISGLLYGCIGLIFVPLFLLFAVLGSFAGQEKMPLAGIFGVVLAILMPVIYGVTGFVMGAISAWLYNIVAKRVGGVEMELEMMPGGTVAPYPIVPPPTPGF